MKLSTPHAQRPIVEDDQHFKIARSYSQKSIKVCQPWWLASLETLGPDHFLVTGHVMVSTLVPMNLDTYAPSRWRRQASLIDSLAVGALYSLYTSMKLYTIKQVAEMVQEQLRISYRTLKILYAAMNETIQKKNAFNLD